MPSADLLLTTDWFLSRYASELTVVLTEAESTLTPLVLPTAGARLDDATLAAIRIAFFHGDFRSDPDFTRRFFGACLRAPNLAWVQLPNSGVDDPVFPRLLARGTRLTNAPGAAAGPIAQTAIAGLLMLARGFPRWIAAQQRSLWDPHPWADAPSDLDGQVLVLVGLGAIGQRIAVLADALGLHVTGVRRTAGPPPPGVAELAVPAELPQLLPRADWLVLACPLTDDTRGLIDVAMLNRIKPGARIINVSRGEIIDEPALIDALASGRLGGAYLDVFRAEPLAAESPLWSLPNVIVTPHDSSASRGNAGRVSRLFLSNLRHWLRGEALEHEVAPDPPPAAPASSP